MTCNIQAWGNSTSITKIGVLQKRVIRLIHKKKISKSYRPSESILKISDFCKLLVSLFMLDLQNGSLPISFKTCIQQSETATYPKYNMHQTAWSSEKERPRTTFSSKLPKHYFTNIWNNISENIRNAVNRRQFKAMLHNYYTDQYESCVICTSNMSGLSIMIRILELCFLCNNMLISRSSSRPEKPWRRRLTHLVQLIFIYVCECVGFCSKPPSPIFKTTNHLKILKLY